MATINATLTKAEPITLPPLPSADNALERFISKNTIGFHYGKHLSFAKTPSGKPSG
jgi:Fe-Mn family superoxide dismutase